MNQEDAKWYIQQNFVAEWWIFQPTFVTSSPPVCLSSRPFHHHYYHSYTPVLLFELDGAWMQILELCGLGMRRTLQESSNIRSYNPLLYYSTCFRKLQLQRKECYSYRDASSSLCTPMSCSCDMPNSMMTKRPKTHFILLALKVVVLNMPQQNTQRVKLGDLNNSELTSQFQKSNSWLLQLQITPFLCYFESTLQIAFISRSRMKESYSTIHLAGDTTQVIENDNQALAHPLS